MPDMLGDINLQIAPGNLLWPIILSGVSAAAIFVPLTTSALGTLSQEQMGNATGIFNLMRNVGGSIGIAMPVHGKVGHKPEMNWNRTLKNNPKVISSLELWRSLR